MYVSSLRSTCKGSTCVCELCCPVLVMTSQTGSTFTRGYRKLVGMATQCMVITRLLLLLLLLQVTAAGRPPLPSPQP
jgi:hypothetical protein